MSSRSDTALPREQQPKAWSYNMSVFEDVYVCVCVCVYVCVHVHSHWLPRCYLPCLIEYFTDKSIIN